MSKGLKHRADNDPRAASLLALSKVMGGEDSQAALDQVLAASGLVPSDKALATELFYGTLRHHLRLEWFLRRTLPKPGGLPGEMFLLLEQSMYELAHTRIPAHAGVNWAVELVRGRFGQGLSKVANGVLRGFERSKNEEYLNRGWYAGRLDMEPESSEVLALWYALPLWLVELWRRECDEENFQALLDSAVRPAPQTLRLNTGRRSRLSLEEEIEDIQRLFAEHGATALPPSAWVLPRELRLPVAAWSKSGLVSRQSAAAYAALFALEPEAWGAPIWDACAGRGGKSMALLERGLAVDAASDPNKARILGLEDEYARLGLTEPPCPKISQVTAQEAAFKKRFRTVLVDAPCSGLGTLSHRPEIRWRRSYGDISRLAAAQSEILEAAHKALMPKVGSSIIYMTCTATKTENRDQVEAFLAQHPKYALHKEYATPPDSGYAEFFYGAVLRLI